MKNELEELQRFNLDLQEQNENYEVLLSDRMLSGLHFGSTFGPGDAGDSGIGSSLIGGSRDDTSLGGSRPASSLDRLDEEEDQLSSDDEDILFESSGDGNLSTGAVAANITPNRIQRTANKRQSSMGLGGGPGGLDLEAELDRARREEEEEEERRKKAEERSRKKKERESAARRKANQSTATMGDGEPLPDDVEGLRKEIKLLRQENKGVSLTIVSKQHRSVLTIQSDIAIDIRQQDSGKDHRHRRIRKGSGSRERSQTATHAYYGAVTSPTAYSS